MRKIWWTWDIRMHWVHGLSFSEASYIRNYELALEAARRYGVEGLVIWGFLRDFHGGLPAAHRIMDYGRKCGVEIYPGFGVDDYGGAYYQGDSPYSLDTFIAQYPEAQAREADGTLRTHKWPMNDISARKLCCPSFAGAMEFYAQALEWLIREFDLQGFQIEQGDSGLCKCPQCRKIFQVDDKASFSLEISSRRLIPLLRQALQNHPDLTVIVETYSGLLPAQVQAHAAKFAAYPQEVYLSWQAYNGFMSSKEERFLLNEQSLSPALNGCLAFRANSEAALGESETPEEAVEAIRLARKAGLNMTYIYGEYPDTWPRSRAIYETWSAAASGTGSSKQ